MTDQEILDYLKQYVTRAAPQGVTIDEVASPQHYDNSMLVPFVHMGFIWVHNDSFRLWLGAKHSVWIGQKTLARIFKSRGWQAKQGVKTIPVNLWAVPIKEIEHGKQHQGA